MVRPVVVAQFAIEDVWYITDAAQSGRIILA